LAGFYNIERPDSGPDWTLRFQIALLFPKRWQRTGT
jgi:DNA-binding XRE family transcriptional regulator